MVVWIQRHQGANELADELLLLRLVLLGGVGFQGNSEQVNRFNVARLLHLLLQGNEVDVLHLRSRRPALLGHLFIVLFLHLALELLEANVSEAEFVLAVVLDSLVLKHLFVVK